MAIDFKEILGIELDESQLEALGSAVNSEVDRARTQASQTAHKNANADWEKKLPELVAEAVAKQTADAAKTAEQRAQEQYESTIAELRTNIAALTAANTIAENKSKVRAAGIADNTAVDTIATMFASNPEGIDNFLSVFNSTVEASVKAAEQAKTNAATAPGASAGRQKSPAAITQDAISQMLQANENQNGGLLNEDQLFADLRVAQTAINV